MLAAKMFDTKFSLLYGACGVGEILVALPLMYFEFCPSFSFLFPFFFFFNILEGKEILSFNFWPLDQYHEHI